MNTAKLPVLTEAEKRELLARAHAGDAAAREQMGGRQPAAGAQRGAAVRPARRKSGRPVSGGVHRAYQAIDHFDPAQPVRFSTYGVPMIIGEIRRFSAGQQVPAGEPAACGIPPTGHAEPRSAGKAAGPRADHGRDRPERGLTRREVTAALESVVEPISLEEPVYTDGGDAMYVIDQVRDPDGEDSWISGLQFRQTVAGLTPREKRIMELRYLQGKTQMEVAREIGISQAQVSRLEKGALSQFRTRD